MIVPVHDDRERLERCLDALEAQTWPRERLEVIVVDNGSVPPLGADLECRPNVTLLRETTPGSYAARNTGLARAGGDVLAFTDSDCVPLPTWVEEGVKALAPYPAGALVGGRVEVFAARPDRPTSVELYEKALAFRQRRNIEEEGFAVTANVFTRRAVFDRVGLFDAGLRSGGDREWGRRVYAAGLPLVYAGSAVVLHPARATLGELRAKMTRIAGGHHRLARRKSRWRRLAEWPRIVAPPVASLRELWKSAELNGAAERVRAAGMAIAVKYVWAAERLRLALTRDRESEE